MTAQPKHTPGPWRTKTAGSAWVCNQRGSSIADCRQQNNPDENIANARLIAAAPDLLEALKWLRDCISETRGTPAYDALVKADAAIAKAEGKA